MASKRQVPDHQMGCGPGRMPYLAPDSTTQMASKRQASDH